MKRENHVDSLKKVENQKLPRKTQQSQGRQMPLLPYLSRQFLNNYTELQN